MAIYVKGEQKWCVGEPVRLKTRVGGLGKN